MKLAYQHQSKEYFNISQMDTESLKNNDTDIIYKIIPVFSRPTFFPAFRTFTGPPNCSTAVVEDIQCNSFKESKPSPSSPATSDLNLLSQVTRCCGVTQVTSPTVSHPLSTQVMSNESDFKKSSEKSLVNEYLKSFVFEHTTLVSKEPLPETVRSHSALASCPFYACMSKVPFQRPSKLVMVISLLLVIMSLQPELSSARSVGVCRGIPCANGGRLLVSNSIWGNCRCRCPAGFVGPYCQYSAAGKRNGNNTPGVSRSQAMEIIRQHLLALSQMELPNSPADTSGFSETQGDDSEEATIDNISRRDASFALRAFNNLADLASIDALDRDETLQLSRKSSKQHRVWRAKRLASTITWY